MCKTRNTGVGNEMWGTQRMGECYIPGNVAKHFGECRQTFRGMSPNIPGNVYQTFREMSSIIPGNVAKHSGECREIFRGMSSNILGNIIKHSGECHQTFRIMSLNIPQNLAKHSGEFRQTFRAMLSIFGVNENNQQAESHLESCQTSTMELFCVNSQRP